MGNDSKHDAIVAWMAHFELATRLWIAVAFFGGLAIVLLVSFLLDRHQKRTFDASFETEKMAELITEWVSRRKADLYVVSQRHESLQRRFTLASFTTHDEAAAFVLKHGAKRLTALLEEEASRHTKKPKQLSKTDRKLQQAMIQDTIRSIGMVD